MKIDLNNTQPHRRRLALSASIGGMNALILLSVALFVAACSAAGAPPDDETPSPTPTESPATSPQPEPATPTPATPQPSVPAGGEVPQEIMGELLAEVASQTGVEVGELTIERAQQVTWPDGSLGCPEPDMMYTQALVPGYWVVIKAGDETFDFRMSETGVPRLCPEGQGNPPLEQDY